MGYRFYEKNHTVTNPFHNDENVLVQLDPSFTSFMPEMSQIYYIVALWNCSLVEIICPAPETNVGLQTLSAAVNFKDNRYCEFINLWLIVGMLNIII